MLTLCEQQIMTTTSLLTLAPYFSVTISKCFKAKFPFAGRKGFRVKHVTCSSICSPSSHPPHYSLWQGSSSPTRCHNLKVAWPYRTPSTWPRLSFTVFYDWMPTSTACHRGWQLIVLKELQGCWASALSPLSLLLSCNCLPHIRYEHTVILQKPDIALKIC